MDQTLVNLHHDLLATCKLLANGKRRKDVRYIYALIDDIQGQVRKIENRRVKLDEMIEKMVKS